MADLEGTTVALIDGKRDEVVAKTEEALQEGIPAETILNEALVAGMAVVGERFRRNVIYVPEVLIAARAMKAAMTLIEPKLADAGAVHAGTVVIGTVKGDLHDIGKNLVAMMLQGGGFKVIDLGTDVAAEKMVEAVKEHNAQIVGMSALLTTTMPYMATIIEGLRSAGLDHVKTMIGGAPVTQRFADEIGADGYAPDAASAVEVANRLVRAAAA